MGVKGLWRLLLPIGRRISLETLEGQILAVDASIWVTQFLKAMRDEMGQIRPAAHLIGFFRRLCKLRFHGIRPVFVFDGATPEIKRRELQLRRRRRDQFVAQHGAATVQRMAKRLLVEQLQKSKRAKVLVDGNNKSVKIKGGGGAFVEGFNLPEENPKKDEEKKETEIIEVVDSEKGVDALQSMGFGTIEARNALEATKGNVDRAAELLLANAQEKDQFEWKDGEMRITAAGSGATEKKKGIKEVNDNNDWDRPVIEVDDSSSEEDENDNKPQKEQEEPAVEYDDILWTTGRKKRKRQQHFNKKRKNDSNQFLDEDYVLQLPPAERKQAIEDARKQQRMLSRKEFMPVAAHADQYSQTQLRNFLRSSKLNRDITSMAKKAVQLDAKDQEGEVLASDPTRRVVFETNTDEEEESSSSSEEEDEEGGRFLNAKQRPTAKRRLQSKQTPTSTHRIRKIGFQADNHENGDSDEEEGFFASSSSSSATTEKMGTHRAKQRAIVDEEDDGGGGFMLSTTGSAEEEQGGGFMTSTKKSPPSKATSKPAEKKKVQFEDAPSDQITKVVAFRPAGFFSRNEEEESPQPPKELATKKTNQKGAHFWRHCSDEEDDSEEEEGRLLGSSTTAQKNASKVAKRLLQRRGVGTTAATMPYAVFQQSNDDENSAEDNDSVEPSKPKAALKSTGLEDEDEVIVLDDNKPQQQQAGSDARKAQELQDQMLAKALQEEEDAHLAASYYDATTGHPSNNNLTNSPTDDANRKRKAKVLKWGATMGFDDDERPKTTRLTTEVFVRAEDKGQLKDPPKASTPALGMMMAGDDESEEDDVDWENGDDGSGCVDNNGDMITAATPAANKESHAPVNSVDELKDNDGKEESAMKTDSKAKASTFLAPQAKVKSSQAASKEPAIIDVPDSDSKEEEVDWQDGDAEVANSSFQSVEEATKPAVVKPGTENGGATMQQEQSTSETSDEPFRRQQSASTEGSTGVFQSVSTEASEGVFQSVSTEASGSVIPCDRRQSASTEGSGAAFPGDRNEPFEETALNFGDDPGPGIDDFGTPQKVDNAAALQQAETTAANLTNWAGRAVRRAIAEHLGEAGPAAPTRLTDSPEPVQRDNSADDVVVEEKAQDTKQSASAVEHNLELNEENAEEAARKLEEYETELAEVAKDSVERETATMTDEMQEEIMQLLQLFGVPYVHAPAEAEAQCVALEQLGLVGGIVTEDSDVFVFGGKTVYKNIFDDQKYVEVYQSDDAEREMGLGHNEMVALAMLLGGDYTEGVKGVGIVNGMEIVSSFDVSLDLKQGLQKFRGWLDGFEPIVEANARKDSGKSLTKEQVFHIKHRTARNRWNPPENFPSDSVISAYVNPVVDKSTTKFSFGVPDMENIIAFCNKNAGWVPEDTRRLLEPVIDRVENRRSHQTRIDQFMRYEHGIKFANVRSKRLRHILAEAQGKDARDEITGLQEPPPKRRTKKSKRTKSGSESSSNPEAVHVSPASDGVAFDTRTVSHASEFESNRGVTSRYFNEGGAATSESSHAVVPLAQNEESLVSVLASDAFTHSESILPADVSQAGTAKSKAQTKSLTSYLGRVKLPEEKKAPRAFTEQYRTQINKAVVPDNRAPPAYAEKSELATTLRRKSANKSATPSVPRDRADDG